MYVSDYGFAANNSYWTIALYSYNDTALRSNNWLYLGSYEYTISLCSLNSYVVFLVFSRGHADYDSVTISDEVRPTFYLTSSTTYVSGSGTSSDPIRIN